MTERTFSVTMTEDERLMNLAALGFASMRLPEGEPATIINALIAKLTNAAAIVLVGGLPGVLPIAQAQKLPSQVWCTCGHISGQHAATFPHQCACDGNRWVNGQGSVCNCKGFAVGSLSTPARDYFARDRKGNVPPGPPEGAELQTVKIVGAQEMASKTPGKNSFLKVVFNGGQAACFDSALWPHIIKQTGLDAILYVAKSGNYLNIVGVRA